jgi:hypothetical protein
MAARMATLSSIVTLRLARAFDLAQRQPARGLQVCGEKNVRERRVSQQHEETAMKLSRRMMLRKAAIVTGLVAAPWAARPVLAQAKAAKKAMQYQEQPKNGQKCDTCQQFVPGSGAGASGTCKVVEGPISPNGWCVAYVKKG